MPGITRLETERDQFRAEIDRLGRMAADYIEYRKTLAKVEAETQKARFDAFLEAGFSERQALDLIKSDWEEE